MRRVVPRAIIFIAISALFIGADFLVLAGLHDIDICLFPFYLVEPKDRPLLREGGMPEDELAEVRDMEGHTIVHESSDIT
eukprot:1070539-Amorphochlora_amoeboformis.AAC.1